MCDDNQFQAQIVLRDDEEKPIDFVARIDNDRFPRGFIAEDRAVALEHAHPKDLVNQIPDCTDRLARSRNAHGNGSRVAISKADAKMLEGRRLSCRDRHGQRADRTVYSQGFSPGTTCGVLIFGRATSDTEHDDACAGGRGVPYQQLSTGAVLIHTRLPEKKSGMSSGSAEGLTGATRRSDVRVHAGAKPLAAQSITR